MDWTRRNGRIAAAIVLVAACGLLLGRLSSFGIWDPWELAAADLARQSMGGGGALERPPLSTWLVASGFSMFGVHEWSGRLPMAIAGLLTVALTYVLVARFAGRRAGVLSAVVAASSPLFLFNARQMLGVAPAFAASAAVFLCASAAVFAPARPGASTRRRRVFTALWLVGLAVSAVLAILASGALLGLAPPLLGVGAAIVARGELTRPWTDRRRALTAVAILALGVVVALGAAHAIWADYATFGFWTGGVPRRGDPPSWEVAIERVFHAFAPWSALLPLALARMLTGRPSASRSTPRAPRVPADGAHGPYRDNERPPARRLPFFLPRKPRVLTLRHPEENALRLGVVAWVAFGFLAESLFTARYGPATFLPLVGAAAAVGLMLHDAQRSRRAWWGTAVVGFLFVGLLIRDFGEYPRGPIEGLAVEGVEVPEVFNPAGPWAIVLGVFALLLAVGLASEPSSDRSLGTLKRDLLSPIRLLVTQWKRGWGLKLWIIVFAIVLGGLSVFGGLCLAIPDTFTRLGMTSLGLSIGSALLVLLPGIVVGVAGVRLLFWGFARLGSYRLVPALLAGLAVGGYASFGFQPALSAHFSPREVYDTYNALAARGEPLGEFRVGGRAAAYYATGEIVELDSQAELLEFLQQEARVWVAFRADDLASVNRDYRRRTGRHLFVADARSARMILATNRAVAGRDNQNYLAEAILDAPPNPEHVSNINFDDRVELIGIDLDLPHGSYVGPGESFEITWYFRVTAPIPSGYQLFVHIDGAGQRINGDHEPVGGRYPIRLWEAGDVIVDRQELRVPANYSRGNLTIYTGFYHGDRRLEILSGPGDDVDRGRAGILPVR